MPPVQDGPGAPPIRGPPTSFTPNAVALRTIVPMLCRLDTECVIMKDAGAPDEDGDGSAASALGATAAPDDSASCFWEEAASVMLSVYKSFCYKSNAQYWFTQNSDRDMLSCFDGS